MDGNLTANAKPAIKRRTLYSLAPDEMQTAVD